MAAAIEAIGVISGILGIVQFGIDNFSSDSDPGSTIKVAVALDGEGGTDNAGGDLPDVRIWNEMGSFVGMTADPGGVSTGTVGEVTVDHDNQGVYSLFSANDDAICIAWVTTTWNEASGGNQYAVSGDYGQACGATWYESHMYTASDQEYQPTCFWIDANGDQPNTGFQVRWPRYSKDVFDENNTDPSQFCNDIDFGIRTEEDPSVINYWVDAKKKRDLLNNRRLINRSGVNRKDNKRGTRIPWAENQLIISDSKSHSAKKLCESETSMGPDFAHVNEKFFCDMGEHVIYAFCGENLNSDEPCFDFDAKTLVDPTTQSSQRVASKYTSTRDWTSTSTNKQAVKV